MSLHHPVGRALFGWRPDRILHFALLVCLLAPAAPAQDDLAALKKLMKDRKYAIVLSRVKELVASSKATVEISLVGAQAALEIGEWGQAGSLGSLATELSPKGPDGRAKEHRGFEIEAHALWRSAQEVLQGGRGSGLTRATFLDAGTFYRRAREHGGDAFENGFWEAEAFRYGMNPEKALVGIRAALAAQPENWDARVLHARILLDLERFDESAKILRELRKSNPQNAEAAHLLFAAVLGTDDKRTIQDTFLELIRAFPRDMALYGPFYQRFQRDEPKLVEATLRTVTEFRPVTEDRVPWFYLSFLASRAGRAEEALALMTAYRDALPTTPEGHYQVGILLLNMKRHEEARDAMLKANALGGLADADMARAFGWVIAAYVAENDYEPAINLQRLVVTLTRDAAEELDLARLMYHGGKQADAVGLVKRLLSRKDGFEDPLIAEMENDLALYHLGLGQDAEAEKCFRRSLAASVEKLDATENLGIFLIDRGRLDEGVKLLERCLATDPGRHRSRYHLLRARHPDLVGAAKR